MVDTARQLRLRGWVRNRDDGAVELTAEGPRAPAFPRRAPRGHPRKGGEPSAPPLEAWGPEARQDEGSGGLSRGVGLRVGLARALVHEPGAPFPGPPTAGLDPAQTRETRDL